jgi:hypothetical protein
MSTLRLVQDSLQTSAQNQLTWTSLTKGRRGLAEARVLGAFVGLVGGVLAPLCGGLLIIVGWWATNDSLQQEFSTAGSVLLFLTIPLLALGACCMDWLEKGRPQPSLKVIRPTEDDTRR